MRSNIRVNRAEKKGFTLIELVVAMAIFLTVITLAVSAFVSVSKLKALTSTMKEVQQKTRIATEIITRLARQADKVVTAAGESKSLELYFNLYNTNPNYGYSFEIRSDGLFMKECAIADEATTSCAGTDWSSESQLLGANVKIDESLSYFKKTGTTMPPTLQVRIKGIITNINNNPYYSNEYTIDTDIVLEGIK